MMGQRIVAPHVVQTQAVEPEPIQLEVKRMIFDAWAASGMSKSELARRMGCQETEARRILNPNHPSKIGTLQQAAAALGYRLSINMEPGHG